MPDVKTTTTPKAPGHTRDAEATKLRILDAAEEEFAKFGLAGAKTEAIACKTGVTKAMLYYYYQSKEELYRAVLERAFANKVRLAQKVDINTNDPEGALRAFASESMRDIYSKRTLPQILFYEAVQNQGKYYKDIAAAAIYGPVVKLLERGVQLGVFRKLDPLHTAVNIIGTCVFYYCATGNVRHLWPTGTDLYDQAMEERHAEEAVEFIICGVKARS